MTDLTREREVLDEILLENKKEYLLTNKLKSKRNLERSKIGSVEVHFFFFFISWDFSVLSISTGIIICFFPST